MIRIEDIDQHSNNSSFSGCYREALKSDNWTNLLTGVGQRFRGGASEFRLVLRKLSLLTGYKHRLSRNNKVQVTAVCYHKGETGCLWEAHAFAKHGDESLFTLGKFVSEHTCHTKVIDVKHPNVTKKLLKDLLIKDVKDNPHVKPRALCSIFKKDYGYDIDYQSTNRAKKLALNEIYGAEEKSYSDLWWYTDALRRSNPGSRIVLEVDTTTKVFQRLFIAFDASIHGFNFCRPLIFLDGTFLTSKYKGCLLGATAKNGNKGFFPLAFAVVSAEDEDNWTWFLCNLREILNPDRCLTFMSDRNAGLLNGVRKIFPKAYHGWCIWHLKNNLRKLVPAMSRRREYFLWLLTKCAYSVNMEEFQESYSLLITKGGNKIKIFMESIDPCHWANLFFPSQRYGEMSSALAESFNSWIREERSLPIIALVDRMRQRLMQMISDRHEDCKKWKTFLCPEVERDLNEKIDIGRTWYLLRSSEHVYEVHSTPSHTVDLSSRLCSCCQWQIYGIPCVHAVSAIQSFGAPLSQFVDSYYSFDSFFRTYERPIMPVPDFDKPKDVPVEFQIKPPSGKPNPGRPKTQRITSAGEVTKKKKTPRICGRCKQLGYHDLRTCRNIIEQN